jgi:hypothetical protein
VRHAVRRAPHPLDLQIFRTTLLARNESSIAKIGTPPHPFAPRTRREFIAGLAGVVALPPAARAQQGPVPVIGYLGSVSAHDVELSATRAFLQGLKEGGYSDGQNAAIEYRIGNQRLPSNLN